MANNYFITKAIRHPGALRKKAGAKAGAPIPDSKLNSLERAAKAKGDTTTLRQIALARTLRKMHRGKKKATA